MPLSSAAVRWINPDAAAHTPPFMSSPTPSICEDEKGPEEKDLAVSLMGLVSMPFADDDDAQHGPRPSAAPSPAATPRATPPPPPLGAQHFLAMFKATKKIKSLRIKHLGTFDLKPGMALQFAGHFQPIPDGLECSFSMFQERWTSRVHYVQVPSVLGGAMDTALEFTIIHERTGHVTAIVESVEERKMRRTSRRVMLICSKVFEAAWRSVPDKEHGGPSGTNESATLFGLKHRDMKEFVLRWYADRGD